MATGRRLWFRDRRTALWVGYGAIALGSYALYEAYEKRGRSRPWVSKLAPGP
jgi:hypothetical protein